MPTTREHYLGRVSSKTKKLFLASATAILLGTAIAVPASAMLTGPNSVRPEHNIGVFHNLDFVAAFGYGQEEITVEVFRGGHLIGSAFGQTVEVDEGLAQPGALEVNHGPEGPAVQGDCWTNYTPDILPGDRVVVTSTDDAGNEVTDEVLVDDISISGKPENNLATPNDKTDVVIEGHAAYADGTPIPINKLDSGELRHDGPRFRANPSTVKRIPGTEAGWRAIYRAPYKWFQMPERLTVEQQKRAILNGDHAMGYGHVAPLPLETQLVEGLGGGGPALGCGSAPEQANAVTKSDDRVINRDSGSLQLNGTAMEMVSGVSVTLRDKDTTTPNVTVEANSLSAGPGEKTWSASFTREQVRSLADGNIIVSGRYALANGGSISGVTKSITKDVIPPK